MSQGLNPHPMVIIGHIGQSRLGLSFYICGQNIPHVEKISDPWLKLGVFGLCLLRLGGAQGHTRGHINSKI